MLSQRLLARTLGVDAKSVRVENVDLIDENVEIRLRPRIKHRWRCRTASNAAQVTTRAASAVGENSTLDEPRSSS